LSDLMRREGVKRTRAAMKALQDYSERLMRTTLARLPAGSYSAVDELDDDGAGTSRIRIKVNIRLGRGKVVVDFAGTDGQVRGGINANFAVTLAGVYYVFQALAETPIPPNAGFMRPIEVLAPRRSVVNAEFPAAVAGGNVETSQRIVDVLLRALARALPQRIPAASCGSMNNVAFGGFDPFRSRAFSYYETVAGGAGAGPQGDGCSAVHTHMTNTMNTPVEALEWELPVRVRAYSIRRGSGGGGRHRGGDGITREIEFLTDANLSLLSERRKIPPWGLAGGRPGKPGANYRMRDQQARILPAKISLDLRAGERLRILTPGGGGWGSRRRRRDLARLRV
jgi:N-methylhydantoinase B